jgi:hypothetical protein
MHSAILERGRAHPRPPASPGRRFRVNAPGPSHHLGRARAATILPSSPSAALALSSPGLRGSSAPARRHRLVGTGSSAPALRHRQRSFAGRSNRARIRSTNVRHLLGGTPRASLPSRVPRSAYRALAISPALGLLGRRRLAGRVGRGEGTTRRWRRSSRDGEGEKEARPATLRAPSPFVGSHRALAHWPGEARGASLLLLRDLGWERRLVIPIVYQALAPFRVFPPPPLPPPNIYLSL